MNLFRSLATISTAMILKIYLTMSLGCVLISETVSADQASVKPTAKGLVRQLGSRSYRTREKAEAALMEFGRKAIPSLKAGLKSSDPEVVLRCGRILDRLDKSLFELELDEFVQKGENGDVEPPVGWSNFAKLVGKDKNSRQEFAVIVLADRELVKAAVKDPKKAKSIMASRCKKWISSRTPRDQRKGPTVGEVGAVVFTAATIESLDYQNFSLFYSGLNHVSRTPNFINPAARQLLRHALQKKKGDTKTFNIRVSLARRLNISKLINDDFPKEIQERLTKDRDKLNAGELRTLYYIAQGLNIGTRADLKKLFKTATMEMFERAVKKAPNSNDLSALLYLAQTVRCKEAIPFAVKLAEKKSVNIYRRAQAIQTIGKIGDKTHIDLLKPILKDKSSMTRRRYRNVNITTQMRDLALACMVHLSDQSHLSYGFPYAKLTNGRGFTSGSYYYWGFSNAQQRETAHKKWEEYVKKNKKDEPPAAD